MAGTVAGEEPSKIDSRELSLAEMFRFAPTLVRR
jgi:hypothetical protein